MAQRQAHHHHSYFYRSRDIIKKIINSSNDPIGCSRCGFAAKTRGGYCCTSAWTVWCNVWVECSSYEHILHIVTNSFWWQLTKIRGLVTNRNTLARNDFVCKNRIFGRKKCSMSLVKGVVDCALCTYTPRVVISSQMFSFWMRYAHYIFILSVGTERLHVNICTSHFFLSWTQTTTIFTQSNVKPG